MTTGPEAAAVEVDNALADAELDDDDCAPESEYDSESDDEPANEGSEDAASVEVVE